MLENRSYDESLARWEYEGGGLPASSRVPDRRERSPCRPSLPAGYQAQVARSFYGYERMGRASYEFTRVYGPPEELDGRGPIRHLDEGLSYWSVTWPAFSEAGDERPEGRWTSYAQAREVLGSRLTFDRFSSAPPMRDGWSGEAALRGEGSRSGRDAQEVASARTLPWPASHGHAISCTA